MNKKMNKKGFTIMEMLIVVAIIAVLVAIAIPTFGGALTKAKEAADVANIRAGYAELQVALLTDNVAIPADKAAFETAYIEGTLNNEDIFEYTATPAGETTKTKAELKYTPTKLNDKKAYTWTVESPTAN